MTVRDGSAEASSCSRSAACWPPVKRADGAGWEPIDPDARYRVVTTDDLAAGDSAYPTFAEASADGRARATAIGGAEALVDYVDHELAGLVSPQIAPSAP